MSSHAHFVFSSELLQHRLFSTNLITSAGVSARLIVHTNLVGLTSLKSQIRVPVGLFEKCNIEGSTSSLFEPSSRYSTAVLYDQIVAKFCNETGQIVTSHKTVVHEIEMVAWSGRFVRISSIL
jgi:hypothetical protein